MYITTKQASADLNKSERTIYAWLKSGKIQGKKINGKWQIFPSSLESLQPEVASQQPAIENKETVYFVENVLNRVFEQLDIVSKAMEDVQANAIAKEAERQEQKKREIEILSRVVKNQLQLKEQNEELRKQNLFLQASIRKITGQLAAIKQENKSIKEKQSEAPSQKAPAIAESCSQHGSGNQLQSNSYSQKPDGKKHNSKSIQSEEKAEKWVRNNIGEWFSKPCGFGQLAKYSFEDIALNNAPKAMVNGKPQPSRAYLHILAKKESSWRKYKAIVALEITESQKESYSKAYNHYAHPYEVGG